MFMRKMMVVVGLIGFLTVPVFAVEEAELPVAVYKSKEMIVTANPLATAAGEEILKKGGTAADAMIVAQTVLGLVESQSSGIGGGAFVVYYDAKSKKLTTFDAREKAPLAATEKRFYDADGNKLSWYTAWQSGLSIGVPGVPKLMETMHAKYGRLPWPSLFHPAQQLAGKGFKLTKRTSSQVEELLQKNTSCLDKDRIYFRDPAAFAYFVNPDDCTAKPAGTVMQNKEYANTMQQLANHGSGTFYHGKMAFDIASAVQGDLRIPGDMTMGDLARYEVVEREPVCMDYHGYEVCGMGPPSSGGLAVGQMLGILSNFDLERYTVHEPQMVHLFAQAGRLAFADRNKYVGDSDYVTVPIEGMLDEEYLRARSLLIQSTDMGSADPGTPPGSFDPYGADPTIKDSGTSHISIVDRYGNALSMTTSVESSFGSGVMVRGFLLNNQLTDFSFAPEDEEGVPIANRVQPGKRPRSSMSPTIVLNRDGKVELVTGSPGGSRIIGYTAQSIINVLDFGMDPQQAINVPHYTNRNSSYTQIEEPIGSVTVGYDAEALARELRKDFSYDDVRVDTLTSGLSIIQRKEFQWVKSSSKQPSWNITTLLIGGADKRRDGTVGGR
ncbi:gamma-glutamyltransferase [Desulfogranum marinum]|uniref:gamma-glutamyltransferase n=1 Tax=Desulfogranum marinum TaxID=453220 RepID=UPI0019640C27|nr:gamma-glutamyltransferase [Desulfogranum marinum]MBM9511819.1 gamma-glutamyltransferase [Desulfogranum marinum]